MKSTKSNLDRQAAGCRARKRRRQRWYKIVSALACVVVFCTTYALILPAITMEVPQVLDCSYEVHTHTDGCYDEDHNLICGQADFAVHEHADGCYDENGSLVCPLPEHKPHTHTDGCFTEETVLACGLEEDPGHTHTDDCYTLVRGELACGLEETAGHTHSDDCYALVQGELTCGQEDDAEHTHTDDCYTWAEELACGQEETPGHTHSDDCYAWTEELACGQEERPAGHIHSDDCYTLTSVRTCGQEEIILHEHTDDCYESTYDAQTGELLSRRLVCGMLEVLEHVHGDECFRSPAESAAAAYTSEDEPSAQADGDNTFTLTYKGLTITFSVVDQNGTAIKGDYSGFNITAEDATRYIFGTASEESAEESAIKKNIVPSIEGYTYSGATFEGHTVYSVATAGYEAGVGGTFDYLRYYGTEPPTANQFYSRSADGTVTLTYTKAEPTDYSGDWAIVNLKSGASSGVAMMAAGVSGSDTGENRAGRTVTVVQSEGVCCVTDSSVTFWHFEKQSDGTYYISTEVDGVTKYLTIGTSNNDPVTLGSAPQSITVTEGAGDYAGMVRLTAANGQAVNLFSGDVNRGFGSYNDSGANEWQTLCKKIETDFLLYDLAVSTQLVGGHAISGSWENTPELTTSEGGAATSPIQTVTQDGVYVYSPGTPGEDGYFTLIVNTDNRQEIREKLGSAGKEFRFDGWAAKAIDGETYLFSEGAEASLQEDGIHITDVDGVERTLSPGTTLTAQWTEVSDIVLFFVNYSGTILDTEGNVSGRNQKDFTGIIAIGRIYYGKQQAGRDDVFGNDANKSIRIKFTNRFNPDDPETQVVMAYVTAYDEKVPSNDTASDPQAGGKGYNLYSGAEGINDTELEKALLAFIQANDNVTIKVSTADNQNNPEIENENATPDNYSVRWYVMKEQSDGWHIDGVMVAKTQEVTVTKTFSGLTAAQVETLLNKDSNDGYAMPVKLGVNRNPYITITTQDIDGQYAYYGQEKTGGQSYTWTLNAITDEQYTLSEENYELDGYDVSSVVVHYYKDEAGDTQISYQAKPTTEGLEQEMVGGITTAVSFNNFYTKTGTGAFAVHKSADNRGGESDVGSALQGAVFALYIDEACETPLKDDNNMSVTSTTNSRGSAYFGNLSPGTYYMKETQAPEGYLADGTAVWKVLVEKNGTEETSDGTTRQKIKVTVSRYMENGNLVQNDEGVVCYDDGIQNSYSITNKPLAGTVRVTKTFEGLTALQMEAIVQNSAENGTNPYYIKLQGTIGINGAVDANYDTYAELYLRDAARGQDGFTFTWMVTNLAMTDQNGTPISYQISEHNYLSPDYMDTVVTMAVNGVEQSVYIDRQGTNTTADISKIQFNPNISDTVLVTNRYINTFDLKIQKVDSSDPDRKLADATFKIYGPYRQSTDTSDQKVIDGATYYYIGSITTDDDGVATHKGLSLSGEDSATFVYYLSEWEAPDGYVTLEEPIYVSVTVRSDGTTDGYDAGILTLTAENTKEENFVHRTLDAVKLWSPGAPSGTTVTLELYRVKHYERNVPLEDEVEAELVGTVTLDGTADEEPAGDGNAGTIPAYESAPWTATWLALPSADADNYNSDGDLKGEHYHYFVRENVQINGFTVSYACADTKGVTPDGAVQTLRTNSQTFQGVLLADMDEAYTVTITNTGSYTLPKSGGAGTTLYTTGGLCLLLGSLLYGYRLRRAKERRSKR